MNATFVKLSTVSAALLLAACASAPTPLPPAPVECPRTPSMPAVAEPPPSGDYSAKLTRWRESLPLPQTDTQTK